MSLPDFCRRTKQMGFAAIDLLFPDEWATAADAGLVVSMGYASRRDKFIATGFNDPANHALLLGELATALPLAAKARVANLIAMFGNRVSGIDEQAAIANCAAGLAKIAPLAEKHGVTVCVELLNSKVDHPGYQGDHTAFGVAVHASGQLTARETAVRHLSYADHGGRCHPHDPRQHQLDRTFSYRRRPRPA